MDELEKLLYEMDSEGTTCVDKNVAKNKELEKEFSKPVLEEEKTPDELLQDYSKQTVKKAAEIISEMNNIDYSEDFKEVMDITRTYIKDAFDIECQIAELKQDLKNLKNDAKEEGVKVSEAARAIKELIKEIKETSDEAKSIEEMKRFIKGDDSLYSIAVAQAN